jgi:hypothetical protein
MFILFSVKYSKNYNNTGIDSIITAGKESIIIFKPGLIVKDKQDILRRKYKKNSRKQRRMNKIIRNNLLFDKTDIIKGLHTFCTKYSEYADKNINEFIKNALKPAEIISIEVTVDGNFRTANIGVDESQLALAIGRKGQNARLASKLTETRLNIESIEG